MKNCTLQNCETNSQVTISDIAPEWEGRLRFMEIGGIKGTPVTIHNRIGKTGSIIVSFRDTKFAIRYQDAEYIRVNH